MFGGRQPVGGASTGGSCDGRGADRRLVSSRLRRLASAVVLAVVGSTLALVAPGADAALGDLTRIGHVEPANPPVATAVSPGGSRVYVVNNLAGDPYRGFIEVYKRDTAGGLELLGGASFGNYDTVQDIIATSRFVYVATQSGLYVLGAEPQGLRLVQIKCFGSLDGCSPLPSGIGATYGLALSPDGGVLYVGHSYGVTAFSTLSESLVFRSCVMERERHFDTSCAAAPGLFVVTKLGVSGDGAAVIAGARNTLTVLRTGAGGVSLQFGQCFGNKRSTVDPGDADPSSGACTPAPALSYVTGIAVGRVDPGSRFDPVYVTASDSDALSQYYYDRSTGKLNFFECHRDVRRPLTGCAFGVTYIAKPSSVAISPDAGVYVTGNESESLVPFFLAPNRPWGTVAQHGCFLDVRSGGQGCTKTVGLQTPREVSVSPDGRSVYVSADVVSIFRRETGGRSGCGAACQTPVPEPADDPVPGDDPTPGTGAPETTIDSAPKAKTRKSTATFTFSANETATFECSLDGGPGETCTSPHTYTGIAKGSHSFSVAAIDADGNRDPSPATAGWKVKARRRR
jgi:DNA-binding beta-propeller fold protein YncE